MPHYVSTALMLEDGALVFRAPRHEHVKSETQARKAAARYWGGIARRHGAVPVRFFIAEKSAGRITIAERAMSERHWRCFPAPDVNESSEPHVEALVSALGGVAPSTQIPMPDELEINGVLYQRVE